MVPLAIECESAKDGGLFFSKGLEMETLLNHPEATGTVAGLVIGGLLYWAMSTWIHADLPESWLRREGTRER